MTDKHSNGLTKDEARRLILVEADVKQAMKEAIESRIPRQKGSRVLLATQLGKLLITMSVLFCITGCIPAIGDMIPATGTEICFSITPTDSLSNTRGLSKQEKLAPIANPKGRY